MRNLLFKKSNSRDSVPFLISGEGRSGTTLTQLILNSHPEITCGPEFHFRSPVNLGIAILNQIELVEVCKGNYQKAKKMTEDKLSLQFVQRMRRFGISEEELSFHIEEFMQKNASRLKGFGDRAKFIGDIVETISKKQGTRIVGFKIMRDHFLIRDYRAAYPGCKVLHLTRDGRDVAASQLVDHPTWGYPDIRTAAKSWAKSARFAINQADDRNFLSVRYEDLVEKSVPTLEKVCGFLGVEYAPELLEHTRRNSEWFENARNHASLKGVSASINDSSIRRFSRDLTTAQIREFEALALSELEAFGYK